MRGHGRTRMPGWHGAQIAPVVAVDLGTPSKVYAVWRGAIACSRGPRQSDGIGRSPDSDQEPGPMVARLCGLFICISQRPMLALNELL